MIHKKHILSIIIISIISIIIFILTNKYLEHRSQLKQHIDMLHQIENYSPNAVNVLMFSEEENLSLSLCTDLEVLSELPIKSVFVTNNNTILPVDVEFMGANSQNLQIKLKNFVPFFDGLIIQLDTNEEVSLNVGEYYLEKLPYTLQKPSALDQYYCVGARSSIVKNKVDETFTVLKGNQDARVYLVFPKKLKELGYHFSHTWKKEYVDEKYDKYTMHIEVDPNCFKTNNISELSFDVYCLYDSTSTQKTDFIMKTNIPLSKD